MLRRSGGRGQHGCILEPYRFQVFAHAFFAAFASITALAVSTESTGSVEQVRAVYPDNARLKLSGYVQRHVQALAPYASGKAVSSIVGQLYSLSWSAERHCRQHGAKNLLLCHDRCGLDVSEQRGWIVEAARRQGQFRLPAGCAFS